MRRKHLVRSLHNELEEVVVAHVSGEYLLNAKQERAFRIVADHAADPTSIQLRMYVGGMGGTGKMHVLNALTSYFKDQGESRHLIMVAPTSTAMALVNGSTYHFTFGINKCHGEYISKKALAEVWEQLKGVDYVFLNEVSMLSSVDLYQISACLAMCLDRLDLPFGGMNMIFTGDFAQLPPAIGGERASLYGPSDGLFASNKKSQEFTMGKAI
ncbi:PIF1-like helicase-domain-containing protein [Armillaria fumosa]|nr:PIF1-like helicase-domain-containing protein [Armillaria fumosa]